MCTWWHFSLHSCGRAGISVPIGLFPLYRMSGSSPWWHFTALMWGVECGARVAFTVYLDSSPGSVSNKGILYERNKKRLMPEGCNTHSHTHKHTHTHTHTHARTHAHTHARIHTHTHTYTHTHTKYSPVQRRPRLRRRGQRRQPNAGTTSAFSWVLNGVRQRVACKSGCQICSAAAATAPFSLTISFPSNSGFRPLFLQLLLLPLLLLLLLLLRTQRHCPAHPGHIIQGCLVSRGGLGGSARTRTAAEITANTTTTTTTANML